MPASTDGQALARPDTVRLAPVLPGMPREVDSLSPTRRLYFPPPSVAPDGHADASRPGPIVQVVRDLDDGCRGVSPLPSYGEGERA